MFQFRKSFYIIFDFILSLLIFTLIFYVRYQIGSDFFGISSRSYSLMFFLHIVMYSLIIVLFNIAMKCYELNKIYRIKESIIPNILVSVLTIGLLGGLFFLLQLEFARFVFFAGFIIVPFVLSVCNKLLFLAFRRKKPYQTAFIGTQKGYELFAQLLSDYQSAFRVESFFVDTDNTDHLIDSLSENVKNAEFIVADTDVSLSHEAAVILNDYEISGGRIYSLLDIFVYLDQSIPAEIIRSHHFEMFSSYKLDSFYLKVVKRFGDILISLFLLILTLPIMLITAFLILITSPGGVFYTQKRVGYRGKEFTIYKFRSMVQNAERGKAQLSVKNDARITWIGKIIRMVRIDELPQLLNILKGDMSFIGPRPERLEIMNQIVEQVPLFKKRLLVKPGLTGWAQVKYVYANDIAGMDKKLSYDLYYINHVDLIFDIKIVLYTFETVIFRRGAM